MVTLLKKYAVKSSSSEKVAAVEGRVFWKSSRSKKAALEKVDNTEYCFSKKSASSKM